MTRTTPTAAAPPACVACATPDDLVNHHRYGRRRSRATVPMCRPCESAVHGRNAPKPGTEDVVLALRADLPEVCVLKPPRTHPYGQRAPRSARVTPVPRPPVPPTVRDVLREACPDLLATWTALVEAESPFATPGQP